MDDTLVIILTLIVAVIGAIGQIKKKKVPIQGVEKNDSTSDFWEMLNVDPEFENNQMQDEYIDENKTKPIVNETQKPPVDVVVKEEPKISTMERNKISTSRAFLIRKDFSLRKAVIYSEILNRKYD